MNIVRRLGGILLALALTAVAAPVLAQSKIYSLTVPPTSVAAGGIATIVATFKNESPNGNSSFNSIQGFAVSGPLTIIGVGLPSGSVQPSPIPGAGVKSINIVSMSPVKRGQSFDVMLTVKADSAAGCTNSTATWGVANVWTGSSLSGETFARVPAGSSWPTTTVTGSGCTLSFQPAPADALVGQTITSTAFSNTGPSVRVKAMSGSGDPVPNVLVKLEKTAGSCTVATASASTGSDGLATFTGLTSSASGTCTLTATTTTLGFGGAPTASFNVVAGVLKITGLGEAVVSPTSLIVSLVNQGGATIPAAGSVALTGTCNTSTSSDSVTGGTVTFPSVAFTATPPGICTIGATGTLAGVPVSTNPATSSQKVATVTTSGTLACGTEPTSPGATFNGTPGGATEPSLTAFFAGWRAANWKSTTVCDAVPYSITNNINGAGDVYDSNGLLLGPNMTAINYAASPINGVLLAHTITFAPVPSGSDGLPKSTNKVKYCKPGTNLSNPNDCTPTGGNLLTAVGCWSSSVAEPSIPAGMDGCIRGAGWVTVAPTGSTGACSDALRGSSPVCIQHQVDILEKQDPPWGMTDE